MVGPERIDCTLKSFYTGKDDSRLPRAELEETYLAIFRVPRHGGVA